MSSERLEHQHKGVHFFKIILEASLQEGKLRVPKSFAKRHWQGMMNPVSLILPNKTEWKVSWRKSDGDVWLTDGWKEFAENVSLKVSHFVVFQFEENSRFNVIVFRQSGLEIKYPITKTREEHEESFSVMMIDDPSLFPENNTKRKSSSPSSQSRKKSKTTGPNEQKTYAEQERRSLRSSSFRKRDTPEFGSRIISKYELEMTVKVPNAIQNIPFEYIRSFVSENGKVATLRVGEKSWSVRVLFYLKNSCSRFSQGWTLFATEYDLKTGDSIRLKMVDEVKLEFLVTISRRRS